MWSHNTDLTTFWLTKLDPTCLEFGISCGFADWIGAVLFNCLMNMMHLCLSLKLLRMHVHCKMYSVHHFHNNFKNVRNWRSICRKNNTPNEISPGFNTVHMSSMYVWHVHNVETLLKLLSSILGRQLCFLKLLPNCEMRMDKGSWWP